VHRRTCFARSAGICLWESNTPRFVRILYASACCTKGKRRKTSISIDTRGPRLEQPEPRFGAGIGTSSNG